MPSELLMEPLRFPSNKMSVRLRAFKLIQSLSFFRGEFILASGKKSNFYLDLKPTMFNPEGANLLSQLVLERIRDLKVDYIGGLEMGAVPLVTAVSMLSFQDGKPIPGLFVRKEIKQHGTKKRIEAADNLQNKNVVILDDVTTTGGSAMQAVDEVRRAGANVVLVLSILDRCEGATEFYKEAGVPFDCLFNVKEFLEA